MLDYLLTDIPEYGDAEQLSPLANNDHCTILLKGANAKPTNYTRFRKRAITINGKISVYKAIAEQSWTHVLQATDVHTKVELFHSTINSILDHHCPFRWVKQRKDRPPWITNALMKTMKARDKAYRKKSKTHKFLKALVQRRLRSSKREFLRTRLNNNQNTKEWWATLNNITNKYQKQPAAEKHMVNNEFISTQDFAEKINKYFISVGGEPMSGNEQNISSNSPPLDQLSIGEVKLLMSKLDPSKSTSSEDYPTWVSKDCIEDICIPLHSILNTMLSSGEYPNMWKMSQITPIQKCSSPSEFKHYRPISLLFHLGKLAEQVIINKMRHTIDTVISPTQFAYQPNLKTTDALLKYVDDITKQLDNPKTKFVQTAYLDFSKAFDRLQPVLLVDKMISYGFNSNTISLVSSFLTGRKQSVKFCNVFSEYLSNEVGSPQGTKLGPLLWLIYVNDLDIDGFGCIKYADDTTFYSSSTDHQCTDVISSAILATDKWSSQNSMILNSNKTVIMNTCLSSRYSYQSDVIVNDVILTPTMTTKFLGVMFDDKLSFTPHAEFLVSKCNSRLFLMRKLKALGLNSSGLKRFLTATSDQF